MSNNKKEQFLTKAPQNNIEWAAQVIIQNFTEKQFLELQACFSKLDEALYKSWGKEMTFRELKEAVDKVAELSDIQ